MVDSMLVALDGLRGECGFPFIITSGFRCQKHNDAIGGEKNSMHMRGIAVDIACSSPQAYTIVSLAAKHGFRGIGVSQKGYSRFVHVDTRDTPAVVWSY